MHIDGKVTGEITTGGTLIVGDSASVQAEISCGTLVLCGELSGNIHATQAVELRVTARLTGDITTPSLMIEKGAIFEGRSKMEECEPGVAAEAS